MHQQRSAIGPRKRSLTEAPSSSNATDAAPAAAVERPFSVIIPALHEAHSLPETLSHLNVFREVSEVIVVDGGSRDSTVQVAEAAGARVLQAPRGRGTQLNAGAQAAANEHLLFLHADCRLPKNAFDAIDAVFDSGQSAGLFAIDFGSSHVLLRMMSRLSQWPTRWTQFGEGALFMQRSTFTAVGGFPDWPLMEDVEMLRRLRRKAHLASARGTVQASPRRFVDNGVWRQTLRNMSCYALFHLGIPPERLVRLYTGRSLHSIKE